MKNPLSKLLIKKKDTGVDRSKTNINSEDPVNYENKSGDKGVDRSQQNIQAGSGSSVTSEKEDVGTDRSEIHVEFHPDTQNPEIRREETWEDKKLREIQSFTCPKQKEYEITGKHISLFIEGEWDGKRFPICNGLLDKNQHNMLAGYKEVYDKEDKKKLEILNKETSTKKCPLTDQQLITLDNIKQFVSNDWTGRIIPKCEGQLPDTIIDSLQEYKVHKNKPKNSIIEEKIKVQETIRKESSYLINYEKGDTVEDNSNTTFNIITNHGQVQNEFGHIKSEFNDVSVDYIVANNSDKSHYVIKNISNMNHNECDKSISQLTGLYGDSASKTNTYCATRFIDIKTDDNTSQKFFIREMITDPNYMDVATYIARRKRLPNHDEMYEILKKLRKALSHIHTKDIAFGNLKPSNIFINEMSFYSDIKLTDPFPPKSSYKCINNGYRDSFPEFIAPEFFDGIFNKPAMDFWSIGKMLLLFCDPQINIDLLRTGEAELPGLESDFINDINDDKLKEILHKCLSPDISMRYTHFVDLNKDFSELSGQEEINEADDEGLGNFNFNDMRCYD